VVLYLLLYGVYRFAETALSLKSVGFIEEAMKNWEMLWLAFYPVLIVVFLIRAVIFCEGRPSTFF